MNELLELQLKTLTKIQPLPGDIAAIKSVLDFYYSDEEDDEDDCENHIISLGRLQQFVDRYQDAMATVEGDPEHGEGLPAEID